VRAAALLVLAGSVLASGCAPTCGDVCAKLESCGIQPEVSWLECRASCEKKVATYQPFDDDELRLAFDAERACLGAETCDAIAEGVCFDPRTNPFDVAGE
jgi:hypothetical protein